MASSYVTLFIVFPVARQVAPVLLPALCAPLPSRQLRPPPPCAALLSAACSSAGVRRAEARPAHSPTRDAGPVSARRCRCSAVLECGRPTLLTRCRGGSSCSPPSSPSPPTPSVAPCPCSSPSLRHGMQCREVGGSTDRAGGRGRRLRILRTHRRRVSPTITRQHWNMSSDIPARHPCTDLQATTRR